MEMLLLVFLCLLAGSEVTSGAGEENEGPGPIIKAAANETKHITVEEGSDATLPCSLNPVEDITLQKFEWKKKGLQKQVFFYDAGIHSNNGLEGQDQQFTRRVDYFGDKLTSGNASITIRNTKLDDKGLYICGFPDHSGNIYLIVLDVDARKGPVVDDIINDLLKEKKDIRVNEGRDVTLNCSLNPVEDITSERFDWRKDGRQVFKYDAGIHSNNGLEGQDQQFKGRVDYFKDKLKSGDASITIRNTKLDDSGLYICGFPDHQGQIFIIQLDVYGKAPKPSVSILDQTTRFALLQCEVGGVFPKPEVHWEDEAGNKLPAEKPVGTDKGGLYDVILKTTVTKTNTYRCVVTQKEIKHQTKAETYVKIPVSGHTGGEVAAAATVPSFLLLLAVGALVVLICLGCFLLNCNKVAEKMSIKILKKTKDGALLQCEVLGASPKPELHWKNGAGIKLTAEKPVVTERGGRYNVTLNITVNKTDTYCCVITQKEISHQVYAGIHVDIPGGAVDGNQQTEDTGV